MNRFLRPGAPLLQASQLPPQGLVLCFTAGRMGSMLSCFPFIHWETVSSLVTLSWRSFKSSLLRVDAQSLSPDCSLGATPGRRSGSSTLAQPAARLDEDHLPEATGSSHRTKLPTPCSGTQAASRPGRARGHSSACPSGVTQEGAQLDQKGRDVAGPTWPGAFGEIETHLTRGSAAAAGGGPATGGDHVAANILQQARSTSSTSSPPVAFYFNFLFLSIISLKCLGILTWKLLLKSKPSASRRATVIPRWELAPLLWVIERESRLKVLNQGFPWLSSS